MKKKREREEGISGTRLTYLASSHHISDFCIGCSFFIVHWYFDAKVFSKEIGCKLMQNKCFKEILKMRLDFSIKISHSNFSCIRIFLGLGRKGIWPNTKFCILPYWYHRPLTYILLMILAKEYLGKTRIFHKFLQILFDQKELMNWGFSTGNSP